MEPEQAIIIGAGPAGLAAAIQLKRYGIEALVFEREAIGGLLRNANLVENYPGFPGGISGIELVERIMNQANEIGLRVNIEEVLTLDFKAGVFMVESRKNRYYSRRVVIASGTKPRGITSPNIPAEVQGSVFYEVYPLLGKSGKEIAILGAGDAAFDYALNLAKHNQVVILNRGENLQCLPLLWERASREAHIKYFSKTCVTRIGRGAKDSVLLECKRPEGNCTFNPHYLLAAFGRDAQLDFLSERIKENSQELEAEGLLYLIGDVKNGIFRQTSIAVGDGVMAAMKIYRFEKENSP